jgi:hypothetical protein
MSDKTKSHQKSNPNLRQPKMAHIRHIKPEYAVHEVVNEMSISARYAEQNSWCHADKYGRFEWKPKTLKLKVLPFDIVDFESLMLEWVKFGFCERYEVDGQFYGRFINWEKHQYIGNREKDSDCAYPAPNHKDGGLLELARAGSSLLEQTRAMSEGEGEGKGKCQVKGEVEVEVQGVPLANTSHRDDDTEPPKKKAKRISKPDTEVKSVSVSLPDLTLPKPTPTAADNENHTSDIFARTRECGIVDPDLPTVGDISMNSLEEMLDGISDGTFETGALKNYACDTADLDTACRESIRKFWNVPLTDRSVLAAVVSDIMARFERADLRWHPGLLKVVTILRAGGPLQMRLPTRKQLGPVRGDVLGGGSALSFWQARLEPHRELLQKIADVEGVPQSFVQGSEFFDYVVSDFQERNEDAPDEINDVREKLQVRAGEAQPAKLRKRV